MRKAEVFLFERLAGRIVETDDGLCQFSYDADYMKEPGAEPNGSRPQSESTLTRQ